MKKVSGLVAGLAALGLAVTACGDDEGATGTNSGTALNTQESIAVLEALQTAFGQALAPPAIASAAAEPIPATTYTCPGGGTIALSGDVSTSGENNFSFDITETINSCVVTANSIQFTVSGSPNIRFQGDLTIDPSTLAITGTYSMTGGFSYTSDDDRAGGCAIDISVNFSNQSLSGSICGNSLAG